MISVFLSICDRKLVTTPLVSPGEIQIAGADSKRKLRYEAKRVRKCCLVNNADWKRTERQSLLK